MTGAPGCTELPGPTPTSPAFPIFGLTRLFEPGRAEGETGAADQALPARDQRRRTSLSAASLARRKARRRSSLSNSACWISRWSAMTSWSCCVASANFSSARRRTSAFFDKKCSLVKLLRDIAGRFGYPERRGAVRAAPSNLRLPSGCRPRTCPAPACSRKMPQSGLSTCRGHGMLGGLPCRLWVQGCLDFVEALDHAIANQSESRGAGKVNHSASSPPLWPSF